MVCASCHGQDGASAIDPSYPQLAGQNERYLARQLKMFQSGERDVALMTAQLIGKSEQDLDDLALTTPVCRAKLLKPPVATLISN